MKIKKILLIVLLSTIAFGAYIPIPAPIPMGNYTFYQGQIIYGEFTIEDPNGPEGLTVIVEPDGLVIGVVKIEDIPDVEDGKKYTYPWTFHADDTGLHTFVIKATDSVGIEAPQQIIINVKGNAPHVFTGCRILQ